MKGEMEEVNPQSGSVRIRGEGRLLTSHDDDTLRSAPREEEDEGVEHT